MANAKSNVKNINFYFQSKEQEDSEFLPPGEPRQSPSTQLNDSDPEPESRPTEMSGRENECNTDPHVPSTKRCRRGFYSVCLASRPW